MGYNKTTWENLPSTNTPINATNLNKIENGIEDLELYSTTEKEVGTWVNGKPIYRRTFSFTANNASYILTTDIAVGIVDECWLGGPSWAREQGSKNFYNICGGGYNGSSDYIYTRVLADQTYIKIDIRADSLNRIKSGYVTLYYTKTSD